MSSAQDRLPSAFCWTRFGTEAGETIDAILSRKERERRANGGVFFWGIGNSVAPGLHELLNRCERPQVLFSPIKGPPRIADVAPPAVVDWRGGKTLGGEDFDLPAGARVTSRASGRRPGGHYALVCSTERPLVIADLGDLDFLALRNLVSGNPLGVSQVTAVVSRGESDAGAELSYPVALRAALVWPYFVRLTTPRGAAEPLQMAST